PFGAAAPGQSGQALAIADGPEVAADLEGLQGAPDARQATDRLAFDLVPPVGDRLAEPPQGQSQPAGARPPTDCPARAPRRPHRRPRRGDAHRRIDLPDTPRTKGPRVGLGRGGALASSSEIIRVGDRAEDPAGPALLPEEGLAALERALDLGGLAPRQAARR